MKNIFTLIVFLLGTCLYSQNVINFKLNEEAVEESIKKNTFILPLSLNFPKSYDGKTIVFRGTDGKIILKEKFGEATNITLGGKEEYLIEIDEKGKIIGVNNPNLENVAIKDSFIIILNDKNYGFVKISKKQKDVLKPDAEVKLGSIINDALTISKLLNSEIANKNEQIENILAGENYKINKSNIDSNLFLSAVFPKEKFFTGKSSELHSGALMGGLSSLGGFDVTTIVDGFSKFIVKRTKQELTISFFEKFREDLKKYPDIKTLFPQTGKLLNAIDDQIYDYTNYLNNLREAFREDLKTLDENLPGIIDNHQEFFHRKNNFELALALQSGCYISTSIKQEIHPGDILNDFPMAYFSFMPAEDSLKLTDLKGTIQSLQLISESLKESDATKNTYWVDSKKVRQVTSDKQTLKIYLGLLLQVAHKKYENIKFSNSESMYAILNSKKAIENFNIDYPAYKQYFITIGNKMKEVDKLISDKEKPASDSIKVEQYANYMKTSVQLFQYCTKINTLPNVKEIYSLKNIDKKFETYFDITVETTDLAIAINRKNYPQAINHVVIIYNYMIKQPTLIEDADCKKGSAKDVDALALITKYGALMANMVNAKTSEEVAEVIESAALPIGSARIKRTSQFNVALNAYVGPYYGSERIQKLDNEFVPNNFGLTAPIGITISKGHSFLFLNTGKYAWSTSLLISLVDLGALTSFRFQNDTVSQIPTIQLKHIMSPGAFLSIGIPNCPLSVNFGAQAGPNLRKVNAPANNAGVTYDYSNSVYWRLSASLCVDLPLLNLYTKSKK